MSLKNRSSCFHSLLMLSFIFPVNVTADHGAAIEAVRLYTLDCGTLFMEPRAMTWFEDTDAYAETPGEMSVPCFLVRHPQGNVIWDTGLGDHLAGKGVVDLGDGFSARVDVALEAQLLELGIEPREIDYVAFSHHHFDHTNNASLFPQSTFLINRKEMDWSKNEPFGVNIEGLHVVRDGNVEFLDLDHDVFNDGTVRILRAPGHTPGHQVLMLRLASAGTVILSGDLYHTRENFTMGRIPTLNTSRADTQSSFDRVTGFIKRYDARLIVQHDPVDFESLPRLPGFLD